MTVASLLRRRRSVAAPDGRMSLKQHLLELRRRLTRSLIAVGLGAVIGYAFYENILGVLAKPYCAVPAAQRFPGTDSGHCVLVYLGALDGITTRLKIAFLAGALITAPYWLFQVWRFITPGLRRHERRFAITFVLSSTTLFCAGSVLAYLVSFKGLRVLVESSGKGTQAMLTTNNYLGFVTMMLIAFGTAFELPLIVVMANRAGVLPASLLRRSQRLCIFLIFVFAAVMTPSTDPFTMIAMAAPLCLLFEASVLVAIIHDRRKAARRVRDMPVDDLLDSRSEPLTEAASSSGS